MADGQAGVFYPPNILLGALLPSHWALSWSLLLHQWWAGLGAFFLVRDLNSERQSSFEASLFAGVAFALSGFVVSHFTYAGMVQVAAWLPWALWSIARLSRSPRWGNALLWALAVAALMTAGHPQVGAICLLACAGYFLCLRADRMVWLFAGAGAALGLFTALPQILASLELAAQSSRSGGVGADFASMGALPPHELINVALPHFWGWEPPASLPLTYVHKGEGYFGTGENHWESCFYVGIPVFFLACWACLQKGLRVWKGLVVVALLLALGSLTPLYGLVRILPGFDFFRFPARFTLVASLALIVLAASALDRILDEESATSRRRLGWVVRGQLLWLPIMALVGSKIASGREDWIARASNVTADPERSQQFVDGLIASLNPLAAANLVVVLFALGFALILSLRSRGINAERVAGALVILILVDLSVFGMNYNPATEPSAASQPPSSADLLAQVSQEDRGRMAVVDRVQDPLLDRELLSASLGQVWGAEEVVVLSPLALPENEALIEQAGLNVGMDHGTKKVFDALAHLHLVDLMGVRLLYSTHTLPHPQLRLLRQRGGVHIYENSGALPRAFAVGCVEPVSSAAEALAEMAKPFDPRRLAFIEGAEASDCEGFSSTVEVLQHEDRWIRLRADLSGPGMLVLTDSFYPGWTATVDGDDSPVLRANSTFKAVALSAGEHEVFFAYTPGWAWTIWLSLIAWSGILIGLGRERWRHTRPSA